MDSAPSEPIASTRFRVVRQLGEGGMGVVFEAFDQERGENVALKTLERVTGAAMYRLKKEFRALADLSHPNLVRLHELFADGGRCFFTMEKIDGVPFVEHLRGPADAAARTWTSDTGELRRALSELAAGVSAIHRAGKIHRDLKSSNVLVDKDGRVVILDFGLASSSEGDQSRDLAVAGTPAYMAPEQMRPDGAVPASDWYAVGAILYEALTGRLPFEGAMAKVLADKQLGVKPPDVRSIAPHAPNDLAALAMKLLEHDVDKRAGEREVVAIVGGAQPRVAAPKSALIGRDRELAKLRAELERVVAGEPRIVHVRGPSGIGKTALVDAFLDGADAIVLRGRCYEREAVLFKSIDAIVDALSRHLSELGRDAARFAPRNASDLCRVFPVLERIPSFAGGAPSAGDPLEARRRAFAALRETFARLGDTKPLVMFIDDLQWGDVDSAAFLSELVAPPEPPRVLLLVSYRAEDVDRSPALARVREQRAEAIELAPIGEADAEKLARTLLSGDDERATAIAAEAHGNPFFVTELARARSIEAGATLADLVTARAEELPEHARALLEIVAIAGGPLPREVALRASGAPNDAAIPLLVSSSLLRSSADGALETYHDRIRETVAGALPRDSAKRHHAALARELEKLDQAPAAQLALHYDEAGERAQARRWCLVAADRAREALAFDRAAALARRALELTPDHSDPSERRALEVRIAEALANAGRGREAAAVYLRAAEGAGEDESIEYQRRAAIELMHCGEIARGVAAARALFAASGVWLPRSGVTVYVLSLLVGTLATAYVLMRDVLDLGTDAAPNARRVRLVDLTRSIGAAFMMIEPQVGSYLITYSVVVALRSRDRERLAYAVTVLVCYAESLGWHRIAARLRRRLADREVDAGSKVRVWNEQMMAQGAFMAGDFPRVIAIADAAATRLERAPDATVELSYVIAFELWSRCHLGQLRHVSQRAPALARAAAQRGNLWMEAAMSASLAVIGRLAQDDAEAARRDADEIIARWPDRIGGFHAQTMWHLDARSYVDLYLGRPDDLVPLVKWGQEYMVRVPYITVCAESQLARLCLARAERAEGSARAKLVSRARGAANRVARERFPLAATLASLAHAGVAHLSQHRAEAIAHLERAIAGADAHGLELHAACARRRLAELLPERIELREHSDAYMKEQGIVRPDRFVAMIVPGFD